MQIIKQAALIILCVLLVMVSSACKRQGPDNVPQDTPLSLPTPTPEPVPKNGGVLSLPMPTNADVQNPLLVSTEETLLMFSLVFEGLVRLDESGRLTPALAENWTCDDSGRTWTFNLRDGVKWHNDAEFTSSDVVYTLDSLNELGDTSYYGYNIRKIESYEAVDNLTVRITMTHEGLSPVCLLTFPIVSSAGSDSSLPIGTGPYRVSSVSDEQTALEINQSWWKQAPYIEKVIFEARDNNETALASYSAGQLNMVPTSALYSGRYRGETDTSVLDIMTQSMETLIFNFNNRALSDTNVRKAIAYAINRSNLISNTYMNKARECDAPIAPDSYAYDSIYKIYDYDPMLSTRLLEEAGWTDTDGDGIREDSQANKLEFRLLVNTSSENTTRSDAANRIAADLEEVGIGVEIVSVPYYAENVVTPSPSTSPTIEPDPTPNGPDDPDSTGNPSMTDEPHSTDDVQNTPEAPVSGYSSDYLSMLGSGDFDLALAGFTTGLDLDLSAFIAPNGNSNFGGYNINELTLMADSIVKARDEASLREAACAFQAGFTDMLPFMVLYFRLDSIVYDSGIQGLVSVRKPDTLRNIEKWYMYVE
ncbi:MAG: peptide ABC transporter substrate-binding protein [Candidatus Gastranaerophilaceae bacterium]|mgnify:CR=1 FL=1|nr:peptide ABC transporter substrate-binding protein [Christensenellales bacterium]